MAMVKYSVSRCNYRILMEGLKKPNARGETTRGIKGNEGNGGKG